MTNNLSEKLSNYKESKRSDGVSHGTEKAKDRLSFYG
ncbi:unnamed protein product, partial [marine sediment metagenome]